MALSGEGSHESTIEILRLPPQNDIAAQPPRGEGVFELRTRYFLKCAISNRTGAWIESIDQLVAAQKLTLL
jgi:hypothetical protein